MEADVNIRTTNSHQLIGHRVGGGPRVDGRAAQALLTAAEETACFHDRYPDLARITVRSPAGTHWSRPPTTRSSSWSLVT